MKNEERLTPVELYEKRRFRIILGSVLLAGLLKIGRASCRERVL